MAEKKTAPERALNAKEEKIYGKRNDQAYLAEHEGDITLHRTAKKAFNKLGLTKLPSRKDLSAESNRLKAEKSTLYAEYRKAQDEMRELMIHKANAEYMLGLDEQKHQKEVPQYE